MRTGPTIGIRVPQNETLRMQATSPLASHLANPKPRAPMFLRPAELAEDGRIVITLLTATPELAAWTLASDGVTPCEVIEHRDGPMVGIDRVAGESFEVNRDTQIVCKLNGAFTCDENHGRLSKVGSTTISACPMPMYIVSAGYHHELASALCTCVFEVMTSRFLPQHLRLQLRIRRSPCFSTASCKHRC